MLCTKLTRSRTPYRFRILRNSISAFGYPLSDLSEAQLFRAGGESALPDDDVPTHGARQRALS